MRELVQDAFAEVERLVGQGGASIDSQVVLAVDGQPAGLIILHDAARPGAADAIESLRSLGMKTILLLTGDDKRTASAIADEVGIVPEAVHAGLLPDDKLRILAAMKGELGDRLTTVFPRQGHYALDPAEIARYPAADMTIERIGDLAEFSF